MGTYHKRFQPHDLSADLVHPGAPAGGCGPGFSSTPGPLRTGTAVSPLPHIGSPAGRHLDWHSALDAVDVPARVIAVHSAAVGARAALPKALVDATGHELHAIVAGLLPGLLMLIAVLAATTALGAGIGAAIGALAFGAGAVPGAAAGATVGFEAGVVLLDYLGIAFLVAYVGKSLVDATKLAGQAVVLAWNSVDRGKGQTAAVDEASKMLAASVALVFRGVLQGVVAFLLAKGTAAVASRVPELAAKLRSSKLGAAFAEWVERNWAELVRNPKLREAPASSMREVDPSTAARASTPTPQRFKPKAEGKPPVVDPPTKAAAMDKPVSRRDDLNKKFGRTGDVDADINMRGNKETAYNFYKDKGYAPADIPSHIGGIDFSKPVTIETLGPGKTVYQWQVPGNNQGTYYALSESVTPDALGINPIGTNWSSGTLGAKVPTPYVTTQPVTVLRSTAAPIIDTWSVPAQPVPTSGGGEQLFSPAKASFMTFP